MQALNSIFLFVYFLKSFLHSLMLRMSCSYPQRSTALFLNRLSYSSLVSECQRSVVICNSSGVGCSSGVLFGSANLLCGQDVWQRSHP